MEKKHTSEINLAMEFRDLLVERYDNFSIEELINFIEIQKFKSNILVKFQASNVERNKTHWTLYWDFGNGSRINKDKFIERSENNKYNNLCILVRRYALGYTIRNSLPWEEFSIGFQALFKRSPNIYNFNFWDYFQNEYEYNLPILGDFNKFYRESSRLKDLLSNYIN